MIDWGSGKSLLGRFVVYSQGIPLRKHWKEGFIKDSKESYWGEPFLTVLASSRSANLEPAGSRVGE